MAGSTDQHRRCAVLGDPIAHSLSPTLHRAALHQAGLAWSYDGVRVPAGGMAAFLDGLDAEWRGLSLTMPLKREVIDLGDVLSERVRLTGVANTVVLGEDGVALDNTDLPGAVAALSERWDDSPTSMAVLGAGATAVSLGLAACEMGASEVTLHARDPERALESVQAIAGHPSRPGVRVVELGQQTIDADIVASTIPVSAQTPAIVAACAGAEVVFEALYAPWPTPLAAAARERGQTLVSGLDLLVHQAVLQFELFTGQETSVAVMRAAGERALAERGTPP